MSELKYLFGPAPSRRLGRSLGINIVPAKICSLDCLYCEAGRTKTTTMRRKAYYKAEDILKEFKENFEILLKELKKYGLKGIECIYPKHSDNERLWFIDMASKYHLHITEGSDFHGNR